MRFESKDPAQDQPPATADTLEVQGQQLKLDACGHLLDASLWTPKVAEALAKLDHCVLNSDQWLLIGHLRRYYDEYQIAPALPLLISYLCKQHAHCRWTRQRIEELFPNGVKTACRYAGLPAPLGRCCLC
jgi:TusE/DsrC/DsvC family sulfur relay protein